MYLYLYLYLTVYLTPSLVERRGPEFRWPTARMAARILAGGGEVKTGPQTLPDSRPSPTNPASKQLHLHLLGYWLAGET